MKTDENYALLALFSINLWDVRRRPLPQVLLMLSFLTKKYLLRSMVRALFLWADDFAPPLTHADFASILKRLSNRVPPVVVLTIFGIKEYGLVIINTFFLYINNLKFYNQFNKFVEVTMLFIHTCSVQMNVYLFLWIIFISIFYSDINNTGATFVSFWGWKCLLTTKINRTNEGAMLYGIYLRKLKKTKVSWYNMNYYLMSNIIRVEWGEGECQTW